MVVRDLLIHISQSKGEICNKLSLISDTKYYRVYSDKQNILKIPTKYDLISGYPNYINQVPNGHFISIKFDIEKILIDLDALGLRDAFLYRNKDEIILSTRIDWLKYFISLEMDFINFGSKWLFTHQFNRKSIIKNVERLISSKYEIDLKSLEVKKFSKSVDFSKKKFSKDEFYNSFVQNLNSIENKIALSLSGGLDSRVMLSALLKNNFTFETHTFGVSDSTDVEIAEQIAKDFKLEHYYFNDNYWKDTLLNNLQNFVITDQITNPVSTAIHLNNYKDLIEKNITIVDGGFGEIWRAEYFKKLKFLSRNILLDFHPNKMINEFRFKRADIFNHEINNLMMDGCFNDLVEIKNEMPSIKDIELQNWLDLLAIKTRLPNFFGYEQKRLDQFLSAFMPFIQTSLLEYLFSMPLDLKINGKFFREIISQVEKLKLYKLARKDYKIPFSLSSYQTAVLLKILGKFKKSNRKDISTPLFEDKELILDLLEYGKLTNVAFYDKNKINSLIRRFKENDISSYSEIDWFLSFEIFRKEMNL